MVCAVEAIAAHQGAALDDSLANREPVGWCDQFGDRERFIGVFNSEKFERNGVMNSAFTQPHTQLVTEENAELPTERKGEREAGAVAAKPSASGEPSTPAKPRRPRGFAAMDRTLVSEIARKGGKAAHSAGTAHEFTTEEARVAGRKGGRATHARRRPAAETNAEAPGAPTGERETHH